ncbi:TetR/AcrR family transcriptional regulator [Companilactobacillus mishanensis]|uniref:TetR/AcrR family transcriptional regulator n=1 Tax=Companilactobacillus mishanensis TaxID=2486008 RepID=A0A5P0ZG94_9LACO|nr:TetR/AcrR family transcriptional regulator [Companilactobacillus mishanensis]MQS52029.1 TetR/AcrR family transcriptional regulator [Companilactobacillus mishanensis]
MFDFMNESFYNSFSNKNGGDLMDDKKQRLFDAAHVLFLERGFKKTSIADIAALADVAVGSFYLYFQSKEDIFVDVYNFENENIKRQIMEKVNLDDDPIKLIREVIDQIFKLSSNNAILQEWFNNQKLNQIIAEQNSSAVEDSLIYSTLMKLIDRWIEEDLIKDGMSKERMVSLFDALTVIDFHQSEIQTKDYYQLLNDLIEGILSVILK